MNLVHSKVRNAMLVVTVDAELTVKLEGPDNYECGIDKDFCKEIYARWWKLPNGDKWGMGAHQQGNEFEEDD